MKRGERREGREGGREEGMKKGGRRETRRNCLLDLMGTIGTRAEEGGEEREEMK